MPSRGIGFSYIEVLAHLDAVEEVLPIGMDEWGTVLRYHEAKMDL